MSYSGSEGNSGVNESTEALLATIKSGVRGMKLNGTTSVVCKEDEKRGNRDNKDDVIQVKIPIIFRLIRVSHISRNTPTDTRARSYEARTEEVISRTKLLKACGPNVVSGHMSTTVSTTLTIAATVGYGNRQHKTALFKKGILTGC